MPSLMTEEHKTALLQALGEFISKVGLPTFLLIIGIVGGYQWAGEDRAAAREQATYMREILVTKLDASTEAMQTLKLALDALREEIRESNETRRALTNALMRLEQGLDQ